MCLRGVAIGARLLRRRTLRPDPAGKPLDPAVAPPVDSPPMTDLDEQGRPEPPLAADETATLLGFLEYQRATLAWKCGGLDTAGLRATVAASSMTLGGLLKHLAYVEDLWCSRCTGETGSPRGTRWTGRATPTGTGTRPPRTPPSSSRRSGRTPWPAPAPWSRRQWPTAAWSGWPGAPGPTVGHPACDGSCSIWSRSTRGTTAMPTSSGSRWTGSPASSRRADSGLPSSGQPCHTTALHCGHDRD